MKTKLTPYQKSVFLASQDNSGIYKIAACLQKAGWTDTALLPSNIQAALKELKFLGLIERGKLKHNPPKSTRAEIGARIEALGKLNDARVGDAPPPIETIWSSHD